MSQSDPRPYLWMLCGAFAFSVMAVLAEDLTRTRPGGAPLCDWQTMAVFRAALVALFAAALAKHAGAKLVWFRPGRLWVRSVAGSCSMVGTFYAFGNLPANDVVTLTNTFPLWVALISWPLYGEAPGGRVMIAIAVGITGVVLVEQPHLEAGRLAVFAALAAAVFTAVAMLGLNRLRDIDPRSVVVHFSVVATVFCAGAFFLTPRQQPVTRVLEFGVMARLIGMGVAATAGQVFLTLAFGRGAPAKVSVVGLTQIVFVMGLCAWAFGRGVNEIAAAGTALVIAPTAWLLSRPRAAKPKEVKNT
ncbi:EamA-like transporter family protein [Gemmata obscuriglobus]|uniref:EamA family transporter n=1 Tax=Gemmata obscuriglobus TaxID=114 RepID=A0A2Z3GQM9_9BACT|nr:DMT family transporter [Gemmata obscuriglobus]AWM36143.1 EamA family transporter [Gemmata obscuriglobus]QEG31267.1 EamA-like transporter family protein [Gemmata obscuriglobus]VTS10606.1 membrane protein : DMT(Drug/metabolite transporter) superfamily permease OS=Singulisphaera acidiphila (strain ATCC BAA-1392 / DSM 18658 / VKM B-2454 / MOB10) GN=Sinac_4383 PE=4 SV=1: EamA [Gemmata obscuriglobus UQM 2246]